MKTLFVGALRCRLPQRCPFNGAPRSCATDSGSGHTARSGCILRSVYMCQRSPQRRAALPSGGRGRTRRYFHEVCTGPTRLDTTPPPPPTRDTATTTRVTITVLQPDADQGTMATTAWKHKLRFDNFFTIN